MINMSRLIPDGIVEKIWEGTITVLSLDLVRATEKSAAMDAFVKVSRAISSHTHNADRVVPVGA